MSARRTTGLRFTAAALLALGLVAIVPAQATTTVTTVTYVYTDALGSPAVKADAQGNVIARYDYRPYGTQQDGPTNAGPGFTGHVNDPDTGLVYMQQRYYDPDTQRFQSVDPVGPAAGNIYNVNRYAYANNNPVVNIDPTGAICMIPDKYPCAPDEQRPLPPPPPPPSPPPEVSPAVQRMRDTADDHGVPQASLNTYIRAYSASSSLPPFIFKPPSGKQIFKTPLMRAILKKADNLMSKQLVKKLSHGLLKLSENGSKLEAATPYVLFFQLMVHSESLGGCHSDGYCDDETWRVVSKPDSSQK